MADEVASSKVPRPRGGRLAAGADWLFRSRETGRITIAQVPNPPLWIFLASLGAAWLLPAPSAARSVAGATGTAALAWWSLDEVLRGVNHWRRVLGILGCGVVVSRLLAFR